MKEGRPTKYNSDMVAKAQEYINSCSREATELPTMEGMALYMGVDSDTLRNWGKIYPEFFVTIKELEEKQKAQLINDGMYGGKEVNSTMAIFLLKANHNMIETERKELVGKDGQPLSINVIGDYLSKPKPDATPAGSAEGSDEVQGSDLA